MTRSAILAIPAMWLTIILPHFYAVLLVKRANKGRFDNANAKGHAFAEELKNNVPADVLATYERCQSAHRNGFENMPLFAAAVLAAEVMGVRKQTTEAIAWTYVGLRLVYDMCYMSITSKKWSLVRTVVWLCSIGLCLSLYILAAIASN
ncbi:hypothetical protein GQ53DRAFT_743349 [Thozetella sp. PMI_491]|nr:hypothetical protein GQ53DRAFT_743349 [Thozetella sp. PMI_491]